MFASSWMCFAVCSAPPYNRDMSWWCWRERERDPPPIDSGKRTLNVLEDSLYSKHVIILVVTVSGWGVDPIFIYIYCIYIYTHTYIYIIHICLYDSMFFVGPWIENMPFPLWRHQCWLASVSHQGKCWASWHRSWCFLSIAIVAWLPLVGPAKSGQNMGQMVDLLGEPEKRMWNHVHLGKPMPTEHSRWLGLLFLFNSELFFIWICVL